MDEDEILEAEARIIGLHPFLNTPINRLFPVLKCILCDCCLKSCNERAHKKIEEIREITRKENGYCNENLDNILERFGVKYEGIGPKDHNALLEEEDDDLLHGVKDLNAEDPLSALGFGFGAYFKMLSSMTLLFCLLTVLSIPQMGFTIAEEGLKGSPNYYNDMISIGNLGYSATTCYS